MKNKYDLQAENNNLKERLKILARDKSHFQLVSSVLTEIASVQGLENVAVNSIRAIMNAVGGTNIFLYYRTGEIWQVCDISGCIKELSEIEDCSVRECISEGKFKVSGFTAKTDLSLSGWRNDENIESWVYPLKSGDNIFGALKIEGILPDYADDIKKELSMITVYLAFSLWNEITATGKLLSAYEALKTESRKLEEEMHKQHLNEIRYRNTIESSFDGFWIVDKSGRFIEVNEAYCKMTGYTKKEILKMHIHDIELIDTESDVRKKLSEVSEKGRIRFESKHRIKDGSVIDVEVNTTYSHYLSDLFFVFIRDISWKKKEEAEKDALQKQLQQAQKMEAIGNLAGGIAHDFNNLLMPIIGYSEILINEIPEENSHRRMAEQILKASERSKDIVNQILMFSRKYDEGRKPVILIDIINEAMILMKSSLPSYIDLHLDFYSSDSVINADASQIHQVIINLVTNAYHALQGSSSGVISISLEEISILNGLSIIPGLKKGRYALLKVSDNGPGIDPLIINRIFEPYFTTKQREKGTGLGLAVVQGIIRRHGGGISADSEEGKGSCFSVYLPLTGSTGEKSEDNHLSIFPENDKGKSRILLVDDEEYIIDIGTYILEDMGYQIVSSNSPEKALEIFNNSPASFDLLITDMTMPGISGVELAEEVRKISNDLPVIICTGYSEKINPENKNLFGINEVLMKPVRRTVLAETVKKLLS